MIGSSLAEERERFAAFSEPQSCCQIVIIEVRIKNSKKRKCRKKWRLESGDVDKETKLLEVYIIDSLKLEFNYFSEKLNDLLSVGSEL